MIRWNKVPLLFRVAWHELRAIATSYSVLLVLVGGVFFYGLLYNYMYAPNVVREVPVAVVDHSHTALSRQYVRWLDATPDVAVACELPDMAAAKSLMTEGKVFGTLYLPRDFATLLYEGRPSVYPFYASTDAFLYYEAMERANLSVMEAIDAAYRTALLPLLPVQGLAAVATQRPVTVVGTALYNPTEGYGIYLIPSVLMIIIFQTLMMLIAMTSNRTSEASLLFLYKEKFNHSGGDCRTPRCCHPDDRKKRSLLAEGGSSLALSLVCGKSLTYVLLYAVFSLFLLGALPLLFDIPHAASGLNLTVLLVPYLLSSSFLGLALSRWYSDAEAPILLIAFFSIGLIFLSGVSFPLELMPWYWRAVHYVLPAAPATLAFVKLSAMEASLRDIAPELIALWVQTLAYLLLAVAVYRCKLRERRRVNG